MLAFLAPLARPLSRSSVALLAPQRPSHLSSPWRACASSPSQSSSPQITRAVVEKTVGLAHLDLSADEIDKLTPEFAKIVSFIDTISELDLDGVEPMSRVIASENVLREDVPKAFGDV